METTMTRPDWTALLTQAVENPGRLMEGYRAFHTYSFGNQMLAMFECSIRGIPAGPMATYKGWQAKGRQVRKGEKAISLWQPLTFKKRTEDEADEVSFITRFKFSPRWFVVSQTDGPEIEEEPLPNWNADNALAVLGFRRVAFDYPNGNVQGYCRPSEKVIAINPLAQHPVKTLTHELAHGLLHEDHLIDGEVLKQNLAEVEAEGVALLVLSALGLDGADFCRGYIQNWLGVGEKIPERNAARIITTADKILRAGTPVHRDSDED